MISSCILETRHEQTKLTVNTIVLSVLTLRILGANWQLVPKEVSFSRCYQVHPIRPDSPLRLTYIVALEMHTTVSAGGIILFTETVVL